MKYKLFHPYHTLYNIGIYHISHKTQFMLIFVVFHFNGKQVKRTKQLVIIIFPVIPGDIKSHYIHITGKHRLNLSHVSITQQISCSRLLIYHL